jgi:hypothetical protein
VLVLAEEKRRTAAAPVNAIARTLAFTAANVSVASTKRKAVAFLRLKRSDNTMLRTRART